jgi:hypothetical protein
MFADEGLSDAFAYGALADVFADGEGLPITCAGSNGT